MYLQAWAKGLQSWTAMVDRSVSWTSLFQHQGCSGSKVFTNDGGEALEQVHQRGGRCFIPGDIQDQTEQGSEQPDRGPCSLQWVWTR